jgi:hypothetical protein
VVPSKHYPSIGNCIGAITIYSALPCKQSFCENFHKLPHCDGEKTKAISAVFFIYFYVRQSPKKNCIFDCMCYVRDFATYWFTHCNMIKIKFLNSKKIVITFLIFVFNPLHALRASILCNLIYILFNSDNFKFHF